MLWMEGVIKMTTVQVFKKVVRQVQQSLKIKKAAEVVKTIVVEVVSEKIELPKPQLMAPPPVETRTGAQLVSEPPDFSSVAPEAPTAPPLIEIPACHQPALQDIDFSRQMNLEEYADELSVPSKTLEGWLAAGILCPRETKMVEKLLRMIREKESNRPASSPEAVA